MSKCRLWPSGSPTGQGNLAGLLGCWVPSVFPFAMFLAGSHLPGGVLLSTHPCADGASAQTECSQWPRT